MTNDIEQHTWKLTYSGVGYNLGTPDPEAILIEDVVHHLSTINRFTGAAREPYSVAQHSVLVSHLVPAEFAFEGLFHDGHEAYTNDVNTPSKRLLPQYVVWENMHAAVFRRKFGLPEVESPEVKAADRVAFLMERRDLLPEHPDLPIDRTHAVPATRVQPVIWSVAKAMFWQRFFEVAPDHIKAMVKAPRAR